MAALLLAGAIFEPIGAWWDGRRYPPQGSRVDLGDGRRMYLDCRGTGSPTVLLEAGHRGWSPAWTLVQPQVATFTRVCSYDRAGLGLSDSGPRPRDVAAVNADLAELLTRAGVTPPYVLVGHSAGGMYQRRFATAHRDHVAGLVLVDSDVPTDAEDRRSVEQAPDDRHAARVLTVMTYSGLFRLLFQVLHVPLGSAESERYPEEARVRFGAGMTHLALAMNDEWDLYKSAYAAASNDPLGDLPLVVIAALAYRPDDADRADWLARQTHLASLSTKSRLIVLDHQTHYIPLVEPEVVTAAIRDLVDAARLTP